MGRAHCSRTLQPLVWLAVFLPFASASTGIGDAPRLRVAVDRVVYEPGQAGEATVEVVAPDAADRWTLHGCIEHGRMEEWHWRPGVQSGSDVHS